jgi:hypothetical protein
MINIYYLEKDNIPFYIGKTNNLNQRERSHKLKYGYEINLILLDTVPNEHWKFWEQHYISLFKSWGFKLTNKNNGGGGPTHLVITKEHREKISHSLMGHKHSEETKQRMRKPRSKDYCKKIKTIKEVPIIQYNKQNDIVQIWPSALHAIKKTNIKGIYNALTNRVKTAGGYVWRRQDN